MLATHPASSSLRRHLLGAFGLICLAAGGYFYARPPDVASVEFLQGSCIKSGLVLIAAWLAFPQIDRLPGWVFGVLVGFLLAVAVRPKVVILLLRMAMLLLPIFVLIWLLRPKTSRLTHRGQRP
jgi:hypothetical protein